MTQQIINTGTAPNKGNGDPLRTAFTKVNNNFTEVYAKLTALEDGSVVTDISGSVFADDSTLLVDGVNGKIVGDVATPSDWNITALNKTWNFGEDGNLTVPGDIRSEGNINIEINLSDSTTRIWSFGEDGHLTLPAGGDIKDSTGTSVLGGGGGGSTLVNGANTVSLESDGGLTIPGDIRSEGNINIEINLSDSTLRRWQFGEDGSLTLPSVGKINNGEYDWTFESTGNITVPDGKGIQSAVDNSGFQSAITLTPYRVLSQTVVPGNQSYSDSNNDFVSATWIANDSVSSITFTSPAGEVVSWISNTLPRYSSITVRINGAGAEYPYSSFNGTNEIFLTGTPSFGSPIAVTEIRFSYQRISKIHIEPDDGAFDIISQPGTDIDIDAGDDLRLTAYDDVTITAGDQLQLRSTNASSITTNYGVDARDWLFGTNGELTLPAGAVLRNTANGAVAFGQGAGLNSQGATAIAIGNDAGYYPQGADAVAIGRSAGEGYQGANAIAIGLFAGQNNQAANSIVLNATGVALEQTTANTFTVKPVRQSETANAMYYDTSTGEITYSNIFSFSVAADDSTQRAISNNESIKFIGAGGVTTGSDAEGNITITGSGGGSSIPTVVTTGAVGVDGAAHAKVQFTVASATTVTAVGVTAIGVSDPSKGTVTLSGSPGTGAFDIVAVTNTFPSDTYILIPFATNASGTGYGAPGLGTGTNPCLARGTMITMTDMSRVAVENITYSDDILVWNFDLGEFASAKPVWIKKTQTTVLSCLLTFSDHSELRIVGDSPKAHRIFNKQAGKFTYGSMPETPIGTTTFNDQGEEITLISKQWIVGEVEFYNVMTDYHMNLFANSILTSMRYNNLYPITDMKFVKDGRTLRTADDYPNVEERLYKGFRLAEQTQSVEEIETHIQWLLSLEVEKETECV